jgi:hypothetical protein
VSKQAPEQEPTSFKEQVNAKSTPVQVLVSLSIWTGYAAGAAAAYTRPVTKAIRKKTADLMPEAMVMMRHAYVHTKEMGYQEVSDARAKRAVEKAGRQVWQAATS